ncbi:hypothetical protein AVEN_77056-1 [Araneus ventricosus]|uniref:Uncharacterized protein n=1 Tax=Araneus ventricosus TaxID=182803 RepID=A0A4Y2G695_ARAVE|nr:hypothetical protein AVEN_77056-1 [Araneus ventricosus]
MAGRHDFIEHCGPRIIAPITSGSCSGIPFYQGTGRWALRVTPLLQFPLGKREPACIYDGFLSVTSCEKHRQVIENSEIRKIDHHRTVSCTELSPVGIRPVIGNGTVKQSHDSFLCFLGNQEPA